MIFIWRFKQNKVDMKACILYKINHFIKPWFLALMCVLIHSKGAYSQAINPSRSIQQNSNFFCGTDNGVPATKALTPSGIYTIIWWTKDYYPETAAMPIERCMRVSGIFRTYTQLGLLDYITTGEVDGQEVVCASNNLNGDCIRVIFELAPDENPEQEVRALRQYLNNPRTISPHQRRPGRLQGAGTR